MTILYLDCLSGAAGDMLLGALIDAGVPEATVRNAVESLDLDGWELSVHEVAKRGIQATKVEVTVEASTQARSHADIKAVIGAADLSDPTRARALGIVRVLAEAEAKIHGEDPERVHLHEAGATDALIDIVGCAAALEYLNPSRIVGSGQVTGRGWVDAAHGPLPIPAPAVLEILKGITLEERGDQELVTPTGAAILRASCEAFGPMPTLKVDRVGYGAGSRDLAWPNVVRAVLGSEIHPSAGDTAWLIETNIDDMAPELIPHCIESLMHAGASDAWTTPIVMKKGRPAITLSVLARDDVREAVLDVIYRESTTLGVRMQPVTKDELEREWVNVKVGSQQVRVKLGLRGRDVVSVSPEYEDALIAARAEGLPLREIYEKALSEAATKIKKRF